MTQNEFSELAHRLDLSRIDRMRWRDAVRGSEREKLQQALLQLASDDFQGTERDLLGVYQAAHSVLPLKGWHLGELARLLVRHRQSIEEWFDVLVEALADKNIGHPGLQAAVLRALGEFWANHPDGVVDRRFVCACRQVYRLGYRPKWLVDLVASPRGMPILTETAE